MCQSELELCEKIIGGQKPFELVPLGSLAVQDLKSRRPLRAEALKGLRLLFDVNFYGNEIFVDETLNARIGVDLGIQPSTRPSHRGSVEVNEQRFVLGTRFRERRVDVFHPLNRHVFS